MSTGEPISNVGGLLLDIVIIGGLPNGDDLLTFFTDHDQGRSSVGAELPLSAVQAGSFSSRFRHTDLLRDLVEEYSPAHTQLMWQLVGELGERRQFYVEPGARSISNALESEANERR